MEEEKTGQYTTQDFGPSSLYYAHVLLKLHGMLWVKPTNDHPTGFFLLQKSNNYLTIYCGHISTIYDGHYIVN